MSLLYKSNVGFRPMLVLSLRCMRHVCNRNLLSSAYPCRDQWQERFKDPHLSRAKADTLFSDLSLRFNKKLKVGAVDVDIFVNVASQKSSLEEMEHLLFNLRKTRRTRHTLPSTHHAVCRAFLDHGQVDRLIELIEKPVEYGIFPDSFSYNMILDNLIENQKWDDASRVAFSFVLQEDFSNPVTNILAAHSIVKSLSSQPLEQPNQEPTEETEETDAAEETSGGGEYDDEETQYIRIPVIRNPFFDDHFDLTDPVQKSGKGIYLLGLQFKGSLGFNMQALGLVLWGKYSEAEQLLNSSQDSVLMKDVVEKMKSTLEANSNEEAKNTIDSLTLKLSSFKQHPKDTLEQMVTNELKKIPSLEAKDIQEMKQAFETWSKERDVAVRLQIDDLIRDKRIKEIMEKRKSLFEKERLLFFFENINKHELDLQEAEAKIEEVKSKSQVEEEYVPPTVTESIKLRPSPE